MPPIVRGGYEAVLPHALAAAEWRAEVIVSLGDTATRAAKTATSSIPIVMTTGTDPVELGCVKNLARPEGNITGFTTDNRLLAAKRIELLREINPKMRRLGVLSGGSPNQVATARIWRAFLKPALTRCFTSTARCLQVATRTSSAGRRRRECRLSIPTRAWRAWEGSLPTA